MASSDPKQGGDLSDMAVDGTKIPGDAGAQRLIPSVPRPDQKVENQAGSAEGGLGAPDFAGAADNATDIPRHPKDTGATGEVITGIGDEMPGNLETKRLHESSNNPLAKGSHRYDKHTRDKDSHLEQFAQEGARMEPAPGEEGDDQDAIRDRKGA